MRYYSCIVPCTFWKVALLILLVATCFAGCGVSTATIPSEPHTSAGRTELKRGTTVGQLAPDFELAKVDGGNIGLKDVAGKPAVLIFWTAWCPSCREEAPHINKLAAEFGPKGVAVIGINIGESDARVAEGIEDFGIKFTVARDKDTTVAKRYNVIGTPTVVFLDKEGLVRYFGNELPKDYSPRLERIIGS